MAQGLAPGQLLSLLPAPCGQQTSFQFLALLVFPASVFASVLLPQVRYSGPARRDSWPWSSLQCRLGPKRCSRPPYSRHPVCLCPTESKKESLAAPSPALLTASSPVGAFSFLALLTCLPVRPPLLPRWWACLGTAPLYRGCYASSSAPRAHLGAIAPRAPFFKSRARIERLLSAVY
jgi:hypothetical protein